MQILCSRNHFTTTTTTTNNKRSEKVSSNLAFEWEIMFTNIATPKLNFNYFFSKIKQTNNNHTTAYRISIYRFNISKWVFLTLSFLVFFVFFVLFHFPVCIFRAFIYTVRESRYMWLLDEIRCQLFWFENCLDRLHIIRYYCHIIMAWEIESCGIVKHRAKRPLRN